MKEPFMFEPWPFEAEYEFWNETGELNPEFLEEEWEGENNGSSPEFVRWVQDSLNKVMGLRLAVDGIMGPMTRSAIRSFQQKQGLAADGIVGPQTERALLSFGAGNSPQYRGTEYPPRPGQTTTGLVHLYNSTTDLQDVLLYDFDINSATLKTAHKFALDGLVKFMADDARKRLATGKRWVVSVDGYASRTGPSEWNKELSKRRMLAVSEYIDAHLYVDFDMHPYVDFNRDFHGFEQTTVTGENPWGRSVRIAVHRPSVPPPPPVILVPPTLCPKSTEWQVRVHGVFSAGATLPLPGGPQLAVDCAIFEIQDIINKRTAFFWFLGGGVGIGIKIPKLKVPIISPTAAGPFTCFRTTKPVCLESFAGKASFGQPPAVGPYSLGPAMLGFEGPVVGRISWGQIGTDPKYIPIKTGPTIINIFSSTTGPLQLASIQSSTSVSRMCQT